MTTPKRWLHIIGICGVTTAPLANMFKKMGWFVSGSDKGIFPPMSDYLKRREIPIELGFKTSHLTQEYYKAKYSNIPQIDHFPDLVVVGNYVGLKNVEYQFAKKGNLVIRSYPEVLKEYVVKANSIVIAGTSGKTTSTALLSLIFQKAGKNPSFMIGGLAKDFKDGVVNTDSEWSIIEGDEYTSARFDLTSKFFHYKAEFVLLTMCAWEHTDVFKSKQEYIDNFKKFINSLPKNGIVVANKNGENVLEVIQDARCKVVTYELNEIDTKLADADWFNLAHKENKDIGEIILFNKHIKEEFNVKTTLLGKHNRENIVGCCALARELGIEPIQEAVEEFRGIARRLEIRFEEENFKVIDDSACSPPKVIGSLTALRDTFPNWHITIIFEPNVGNRTKEALPLFKGVFEKADEVIIPHLKPIKTEKGEKRVLGKELSEYLEKSGMSVKYIRDDNKLVEYVSKKDVGKHIVCFMGAYGWRRMIEGVIRRMRPLAA